MFVVEIDDYLDETGLFRYTIELLTFARHESQLIPRSLSSYDCRALNQPKQQTDN